MNAPGLFIPPVPHHGVSKGTQSLSDRRQTGGKNQQEAVAAGTDMSKYDKSEPCDPLHILYRRGHEALFCHVLKPEHTRTAEAMQFLGFRE